ncbi:unnamed protein product [Clonostachys rosea f. rosea IK726]|uniref:Uncharacterized protein n=1 Tax=Clonostachys rosea f. rosea IK726 TaxID=1349383 RepID=A0ACA9U3D0_BIOOC|nr:unnamed protein product [Clonostachys rosea f. rosea IK726]
MSFDMMIHLAAVENYFFLDDGIILLGYFTALVPIEQQHGGRGMQWHLEFADGSDDCLHVSNLTSIKGEWFKTGEKSLLQQFKCFLGWSELANIALERRQVARVEGFEAGVQAGFTLGPILNLAPKATRSWVFHSTVQHFGAPSSYMQAINLSRGKVALVLDSKTKQAWLVPFLSLALHLCQRYWQEIGDMKSSPIPFANLQSDGAEAAFSALHSNGDLIVSGIKEDGETLRSLFLRINSNLLQTQRTRAPSKQGRILASELLDIVIEPSRGSPLKRVDVPERTRAWLPLVEKVDCVGVCADLGLAIQPVKPQGRNCGCFALPEDKFYLAAHMWCLDQLAQKSGSGFDQIAQGKCRLGEGLIWNTECLQWANCTVNNRHVPVWSESRETSILQQVSGNRNDSDLRCLQGTICNGSMKKEGVVVFGDEEQPKRLEKIKALAAKLNTWLDISGSERLFDA